VPNNIDAIDLVKAMVDAVKGRYAKFSGGVFIHPKVDYRVGEGRTFLRSSNKKYDIIQMFSNHTSSSLAHGSGALSSVYLQTAEAYMEYF
jgi:spermidine synthase